MEKVFFPQRRKGVIREFFANPEKRELLMHETVTFEKETRNRLGKGILSYERVIKYPWKESLDVVSSSSQGIKKIKCLAEDKVIFLEIRRGTGREMKLTEELKEKLGQLKPLGREFTLIKV